MVDNNYAKHKINSAFNLHIFPWGVLGSFKIDDLKEPVNPHK